MQPKTKITLVGNNKIVNYNDKTLFIKKRTSYLTNSIIDTNDPSPRLSSTFKILV